MGWVSLSSAGNMSRTLNLEAVAQVIELPDGSREVELVNGSKLTVTGKEAAKLDAVILRTSK